MTRRLPLLLLTILCLAAGPGTERIRAGERTADAGEAGTTAAFSEATSTFEFARGLMARGLYSEAVQEFTKFLTRWPEDPRVPRALLWRGESHFRLDIYSQAARDFYDYLTKHKTAAKQDLARLRYGCCLFELKKHEPAIATLEPLIASEKTDPDLRQAAAYYLGLSYHALRRYDKALERLNTVQDHRLAGDALFARAEVTAAQGEHVPAAALFAEFREKFPDASRAGLALLRRAEELRIAGKLDEAAKAFQQVLETETEDKKRLAEARYGLAWVRYLQSDHTAARDLAKRVAQSGTKDLARDARYLLGLASLQLKDPAAAEAALAKVDSGPYAREALRKLAWAKLAAGKPKEVLATVDRLLKTYPDTPRSEADYLAGKALAEGREWKRAVQFFRQAREAGGAYHAEAAYDLAQAYASMKAYPEAAEAYGYFVETFPAHGRLVDALVGRGQALVQSKKYEAALPVYVRLGKEENVSAKIREHALAQKAVCFYYLKQYANMKAAYESLLEAFPKGPSAPEALFWLGWYEASEKRFGQAADYYKTLLETFPDHALAADARYRRAISLYRQGEEAAAAEAIHEIVKDFPKTPMDEREILWAGQYMMRHSRFAEADTIYDALLERQPSRKLRALTLYYQAETRRQQEDWKGALAKYRRLLAEKETGLESASRFGEAVCLRHLGRLQEARGILASLALSPDDPLVAHYHLEVGLLDMAQEKWKEAVEHLMRVGLLYDDKDLSGQALLAAGEACLKMNDSRRARICFRELAGAEKGGYGDRYPDSPYTAKGKTRLAAMDSPPKKDGGEAPR